MFLWLLLLVLVLAFVPMDARIKTGLTILAIVLVVLMIFGVIGGAVGTGPHLPLGR